MRSLVILVALLLALTVTAGSQVRRVSTTARERNEVTYNQLTDSLNAEIGNLNTLNQSFPTVWQVRPEKRLPHLQAMREQLEKMIKLNLHYDEEQE